VNPDDLGPWVRQKLIRAGALVPKALGKPPDPNRIETVEGLKALVALPRLVAEGKVGGANVGFRLREEREE
jgi:hypothetical protein